jgi:lipopolysaccharide biosynthesis glycosyltransferase
MKKINVCYLINEKFLPLTLTSIDYINRFFKSKEHKLQFYIIGMDEFDVPENIIYVPSSYKQLPMDWQRAHIPDMIQVDKVLYLDSDTVTTTCVSKLWGTELDDNIIGAVQHYIGPTIGHMAKAFGLSTRSFTRNYNKPFFNSGVMLIDCLKWRANNITAKCFDILKEYADTKWSRRNEPAFSVALVDKWKMLDERWNYLPRGSYKKAFITHYYGQYFGQKPMHNMF